MAIRAGLGIQYSQVRILPPRPNFLMCRRSQTAKALVLETSYCEFESRRLYQVYLCRSGGMEVKTRRVCDAENFVRT